MPSRTIAVVVALSVVMGTLTAVLGSDGLTHALVVAASLSASGVALALLARTEQVRKQVGMAERTVRRHGRRLGTVRRDASRHTRMLRRLLKQQRATRTASTARHHEVARRLARLESSIAALTTTGRPRPTSPATQLRDLSSQGEHVVAGLAFDGVRPHVVLLLQSLSSVGLFAGIRTAVIAAAGLARELGRPLRIVVFDPSGEPAARTREALQSILAESGHQAVFEDLRLSTEEDRDPGGHHGEDVWLATFWTTAWALDRLVRADRVEPTRVVYLVQDWEPGFYPWGDLHAKALSTYQAGFHPLVNSRPLAAYVADQTRLTAAPVVFAPAVDQEAMTRAAQSWQKPPSGTLRLFFYARPSKPRNMFTLGLQALRSWGESLPPGVRPVVKLAGEPLEGVDLGPAVDVETLGKLSYAEYYALLSEVDLGLALMHSPHPGHPALELPAAGVPTVTNRFGAYRAPWTDGLVLADSHPESIADALAGLTRTLLSSPPDRHVARVTPDQDLGGSLEGAVSEIAGRLRQHL